MDLLSALESSGFASWVRESPSLWAYPTIIFLHSAGLVLVVGLNVVLDLAILGFAPGVEFKPLEKLFPFIAVGFGINMLSGAALAVADATTMLLNPIFWVKMIAIVLAVGVVFLIKRRVFNDPWFEKKPTSAGVRLLAAASLLLWVIAITAGRLTAYLGQVNGGVPTF